MQLAPLNDAPIPICATSLDPYGQLIKMILPRAQAIAIYDRLGIPLWANDGVDDCDLHRVLQNALASEMANPDYAVDGSDERLGDQQAAYVFMLRDSARALLGMVGVVSRDSREPRPFSLVQGLLRPALECLQRELAAQSSIGDLQRSLVVRDRDLELLLGAAQQESQTGDATDDFAELVQGCVDHLGCTVGALLIPDKSIAVCRTGKETAPRVGAEILTRTHRHLIGWTQLHRRTLTANEPMLNGPFADVQYKMLACPIHGAQRVHGALVLFKPMSGPDFDLRQVRIVELLARRVGYILLNAYDPITGLLTRPAFEKRAQALLTPASLRSESNCVIYVDIDRLHVLNENLGMHVGDDVITRVADVVRRSLTPRMLAARISGDRFAILMPEVNADIAQDAAEGLRNGFEKLSFVRERQTVEVSASFGVAVVADGEHPLSHALASAEIACKAAKDRGRNRVEVYAEGDQSIVRRYTDLTLIGTVRAALLDQRFRLEAQTVVPLNGAPDTPKYELLLRMNDEMGDSVPPDKFLSAAERYQLAPAIDRWVVRRVIELLQPHASVLEAQGANFAVNISGQSLGDQEFAAFIEAALRDCKLPLSLLSFEVTETAAVANIVRAEALIRRLRELGCHVALDDFGRGLSSLTYLKTLPVTHLKIDGTFVRDVVDDERSQAMLSAIVQLARAMNLKTIAECVESDAICAVTRALGVDYGQGFSLGRPIQLEKVLAELVGAKTAPGPAPVPLTA